MTLEGDGNRPIEGDLAAELIDLNIHLLFEDDNSPEHEEFPFL